MTSSIQIRAGAATDHQDAKRLIYESSHELMNFMFGDRDTAEKVIERLFRWSRGHFSHRFSTVAVRGQQIVGIQLGYDKEHLAGQELLGSISLFINAPASRWWHLLTTVAPVLDKYIPKPSPGTYYINNIAVMNANRGEGIGKELLVHTIASAKAAGYRGLELDVTLVNEPAIGFYKRHGFSSQSESGSDNLHKQYGLPPLVRMLLPL